MVDPLTVISVAKSVISISKCIYDAIDGWIKANKAIPGVLDQLRTTTKSICEASEHLKTIRSEELSTCLADLECSLISTESLVQSFLEKSNKFFFNPKGKLQKLQEAHEELMNVFGLLSRALKVGASVQFNASNVLKDPEALKFWTRTFGEDKFQGDYETFVQSISIFPGITPVHISNLKSKKPPKRISIYCFASSTSPEKGGMKGLILSLQYNNPFSEEQTQVSRIPAGTNQGSVLSVAGTNRRLGVSALARSARSSSSGGNNENKYFYIVSDMNGACLTVYNGLTQPGAAIVSCPFNASPAQLWKFDRLGCLKNRNSGLVIDVEKAPEPGNRIVQWVGSGTPSQQWFAGPDGHLRSSAKYDLCIDIDNASANPNTPLILWHCRTPKRLNQCWRFCTNPESLVQSTLPPINQTQTQPPPQQQQPYHLKPTQSLPGFGSYIPQMQQQQSQQQLLQPTPNHNQQQYLAPPIMPHPNKTPSPTLHAQGYPSLPPTISFQGPPPPPPPHPQNQQQYYPNQYPNNQQQQQQNNQVPAAYPTQSNSFNQGQINHHHSNNSHHSNNNNHHHHNH